MITSSFSICVLFGAFLLYRPERSIAADDADKPGIVLGSLQQDVNISCPLSGQGIIWTREPDDSGDRKIITAGHKYTLHRCSGCPHSLQINSLTEDDEGMYACFVNGQEPVKFRVKLIVPITGLALTTFNQNEQESFVGVADATLIVSCSVTKSRPKPLLSVHTEFSNKRPGKTRFEQMPEYYKSQPQSDGSFMTQSRFKTNHLRKEDDLSFIVCEAVLPGLRLHTSRVARPLRVHYPPECSGQQQPTFVAINRTNSIQCPILRAYPSVTEYSWSTGQLEVDGPTNVGIIRLRPRHVNEIQDVTCSATNGVGSAVKCRVQLALGGKPDPVTDCTWSYPTNHSLQIGCKLGFDQGDPYQQCVLYREDPESGLMTEYARARRCSFVLDPTDRSEKHKLQVFSLNKYGDSLQQAFTININKRNVDTALLDGRKKRLRLSIVLLLAGLFGATLVLCCWYGNSGGGTYSSTKRKRQKDKYLEDKEQARCYRRALREVQCGDTRNMLLPLVNDSFLVENGNAQDSSTVSSYLPAVDHNGMSIFHCLPDTPPPVSARTQPFDFTGKRTDKEYNSSKTSADSDNTPPPPFTPRHSLSRRRNLSHISQTHNCCLLSPVTDC